MAKTALYILSEICMVAGLVQPSGAAYWTAYVRQVDSVNSETSRFDECGIYGRDSPLLGASGRVELPVSNSQGCGPHPVFNVSQGPWIALIERGGCTFTEKINASKMEGALGVVIYNVGSNGDKVGHMDHEDIKDIVAIMIGHNRGTEIVNKIQRGQAVSLFIRRGKPYGYWMQGPGLFLMGSIFLVVTVASIGYIIVKNFFSALQIVRTVQPDHQLSIIREVNTQAVVNLKVRSLKIGDKEIGSDSCAICIESYKAGDVVTTLTCSHVFHGSCVKPWLFDHRTCPMCKRDILEDLTYTRPPPDGRFGLSAVVVGHDVQLSPSSDSEGADENRENDVETGNSAFYSFSNQAFQGDLQSERQTTEQ